MAKFKTSKIEKSQNDKMICLDDRNDDQDSFLSGILLFDLPTYDMEESLKRYNIRIQDL